MSKQEEFAIKERYYNEAISYMNDAKKYLKKADNGSEFYDESDIEYVQEACGIACHGLLTALDGFLTLKGAHTKGENESKNIEYYQEIIATMDREMSHCVDDAHYILYWMGFCNEIYDVAVIEDGFDLAYQIIDKINPR